MKLKSGIYLFLLFLSSFSNGQLTIIHGTSKEYAGENILVNLVVNPITGKTITLDTILVHESGYFSAEFELEELNWIEMDLGVYKCVLMVGPGYLYQVSLPTRRDKTEEEIRSPFFEPTILHLRVSAEVSDEDANAPDLNSEIFHFDTLLFRINAEQLMARSRKKRFPIDSLLLSIEESYKYIPSAYFSDYRKYRYGLIQMNSGSKSLKDIYNSYLSVEYPALKNPAYLDLFNKMYAKFFYYFSRTKEGNKLNQVVNLEHNHKVLRRELQKHNSIPNDTIADLVILKEVNESFYRDFFYKEALLMILDSIIADPSIPIYSEYAMDIKADLTNLMIGTSPPEISLLDQNGQRASLDDFDQKYILLMFCTPNNYSCMKEYPFLKSLHEKHKEYLEVITVMITESHSNMQDFMRNNKYRWTSLFYENSEKLLKAYKIRTYPTCYLIGPDGKLIQSPATLPTEGLEQQLFRIMRSRGDL
jgi:peroxiredoxin